MPHDFNHSDAAPAMPQLNGFHELNPAAAPAVMKPDEPAPDEPPVELNSVSHCVGRDRLFISKHPDALLVSLAFHARSQAEEEIIVEAMTQIFKGLIQDADAECDDESEAPRSRALCKVCGEPIEISGQLWRHSASLGGQLPARPHFPEPRSGTIAPAQVDTQDASFPPGPTEALDPRGRAVTIAKCLYCAGCIEQRPDGWRHSAEPGLDCQHAPRPRPNTMAIVAGP